MPTPASGQISLSDVALIVYNSSTNQTSLAESDVRFLANVMSGEISLSNLYNKPVANSINYTTPGTYTFICPAHQTLNIDVRGARGGGGGGGTEVFGTGCFPGSNCPGLPGANGTNSSFASTTPVIGGSGRGGNGGCGGGSGGTNGTGSGGTDQGPTANGGAGGTQNGSNCTGQQGGKGNIQTKTWTYRVTSGYPVWQVGYTVTVGQGGAGGGGNPTWGGGPGANGANGSVSISWS
jgi:hypothetical protein